MSVSNQTNKVYGTGNGVTVTFSFSFKIFDTSELYAYKINNTTGVVTGPLVYTTDFTAAISSVTEGGTITFVVAPTSNETWFLKRLVPYTQTAIIPSEGPLPGKQIENQLDLITMMVVQANESVSRCAQLASTSLISGVIIPDPVDGLALAWSGTSGLLVNSPINAGAVAAGITAAAASASAASSSASSASTSAATATTQATTATTQATAAAASAAAAAASAASTKPYIKCSNTQNSGTGGGTSTSGSWQTMPLNTKDSDTTSIATLSANQVSLPAGTYRVTAYSPFYAGGSNNLLFQTRVYNVTDSAILINGNSGALNNSASNTAQGLSTLTGIFTLSGTKTVALQYSVTQTINTIGLGQPGSFGTEVYAVIEFTKVS